MAVHELATNAAKYGALSVADGEVAVDWRVNVAERLLHFRWEEAGGPKVEQPETKGFGSMLLKRALAAQLDAVVEVEFAPFGLSCSITAPLDRIAISS
jgi:two-component sensor histidine kinase